MPTPRTLLPLAAALGVVQAATSQAFTLQDANMRFGCGPNAVVGGFSTDDAIVGASCVVADNVYSWHWAYAPVGSGGVPLDHLGHGSTSRQVLLRSATRDITDVDSLGLFDVQLFDSVQSTGPDGGRATHAALITNRTGATLDLRWYLFFDIDHEGTSQNFTLPNSAPNRIQIDSVQACDGQFEVYAIDPPDHYQVDTFASSTGPNENIENGVALPDTGLPFASPAAPADFTGAFEWTLSLAPGASRLVRVISGHNDIHAGPTATSVHVGTSLGAVTLDGAAPILGAGSFSFDVGGGGTAVEATVLLGVDPNPTQFAFAGLAIMAPASGVIASPIVPLTAGSGSRTFPLGPTPSAAGITFCLQAFVLEPTSPANLPIVHSDVLLLTIGD